MARDVFNSVVNKWSYNYLEEIKPINVFSNILNPSYPGYEAVITRVIPTIKRNNRSRSCRI